MRPPPVYPWAAERLPNSASQLYCLLALLSPVSRELIEPSGQTQIRE